MRNGAEMWGGCLCAGEGLNLQTRLEGSCASTCLQDVQGLVPSGASSFPSVYGVRRWLAWTRSLIFRGQSWVPVPTTVSRSSVLEQGLMPNCSQTASWPAMGVGLLREPCLGYWGQEERALTETFSCDFKFSFLHGYKMQSFQSKLYQGCVS